MIMAGLIDKKMKKGFRGEVLEITDGKSRVICYVYDEHAGTMRFRKHLITNALNSAS